MNLEAGTELVAEALPPPWSGGTDRRERIDGAPHAPDESDATTPAAKTPSSDKILALARSWSLRAGALLAGLVLWYWAARVHLDFYVRFENVPTPLAVADALWRHAHEQKFYINIAVSLERIAAGYLLAAVVGILLGLMMGRLQTARDLLMPYIELLRPIPAVAWIPLAILMWPTEESSIIYIVFLGALFPIVLNTIHGVEQTSEVHIRAAETLGANRVQIFWHVIFPASLPSIAAGLSVGMGVAWFSLLAGEIISGQYGIGYFTWNAYSLIQYPDIVVGMLLIGVFGTLSAYCVTLLMRPLLGWQRRAR
jgi:NitT/TauT family transport system permease protein